jgi:ATP-dependent DNA ligase
VRLYSRPGNDFTRRFPLIVDAIARLRSRSCIIDGEAVACDDNGVASRAKVDRRRAEQCQSRGPRKNASQGRLAGTLRCVWDLSGPSRRATI